jgi:hypothetical protein
MVELVDGCAISTSRGVGPVSFMSKKPKSGVLRIQDGPSEGRGAVEARCGPPAVGKGTNSSESRIMNTTGSDERKPATTLDGPGSEDGCDIFKSSEVGTRDDSHDSTSTVEEMSSKHGSSEACISSESVNACVEKGSASEVGISKDWLSLSHLRACSCKHHEVDFSTDVVIRSTFMF